MLDGVMSQNAVGLAFGGGMAEMKKQGQVRDVSFCFFFYAANPLLLFCDSSVQSELIKLF